MKVGIFLTNQHRLHTDMVSALDEQFAMVHLARERGWDFLGTGQHYLNEGDNQQLQMVPFLARLQAKAGEMTLGMAILLLNLHNPVYVAETVASLDVICRGNFVFGVGLGYRRVEFDAFRVPKGQRVARLEECLALVKRLWREEEASHDSEVCKLERVRLNIRPVQKPHPPIWFGANNDAAVRRAARLGDAWLLNPHATVTTLTRQMALFRVERALAGLPPPVVQPAVKEIFCARNREAALEMAGPFLAKKYADYARWGQDQAMPPGETFQQPFEELLKDRFVLGTPEQCFEQLRPYWEQLGVNHLTFRTHWPGMPLSVALSSMRLISDELLPALRGIFSAPRPAPPHTLPG